MIDGIHPTGAGHTYTCSCGYEATGTRAQAEKAQRIHRHRYRRHGRCNHKAHNQDRT